MAKANRKTFNHKSTGAGVAWNCTKCGKTGLATNRGEAGRKFDAHPCTD